MRFLITLSIIFLAVSVQGQALVYKPKNPNFGGDTFNYQYLQNSADAQNSFTAKTTPQIQKTELQLFTENLNSQILSQVSRSIFTQQFGTNGISIGSYTFGSLAVEVYPSLGGLTVDILDTNTGDQTQVIIPN